MKRRTPLQALWRDVPGFEGLYKVSPDGQVKSMGRQTIGGSRGGPCMKTYQPRILTPVQGGRGKPRARVNLYFDTSGSGARKQSLYIVDIVRTVFGDDAVKALPEVFQKRARRVA